MEWFHPHHAGPTQGPGKRKRWVFMVAIGRGSPQNSFSLFGLSALKGTGRDSFIFMMLS